MEKKLKKENPKKKYKIFIICTFILLLLLLIRLFYLQTIKSSFLKEMVYNQLITTRVISTKRGTIYDSSGNQLAMSSEVDTVTINPSKIKVNNNEEKTKELKEKVAKGLSDIFELDYEETLEKVNSQNSVETIIKKVEEDKVNTLKDWMEENKISAGINIDSDTKRYYPYNNLASNLVGFCGDDNQGLEGIEYYWDSILSGTPGKIVTTTDAAQSIIPDKNEQYIPAENGSNITLTIDLTIQSIAEKYLKQAVIENNCSRGGNIIIMDPSTGDILAMATYPDYNLNSPFEPNESLSSTWDTLSNTAKNNSLQKMWRNKSVSDTYEPGSTFKLITASAALEEGIIETDALNDFNCIGYESVSGSTIKCTGLHGSQTLRQALQNSCNPAFIQLGQRLGADNLYKYMNAFGLFTKTGIATSGEVTGLYFSSVGPVELATASFGQRFTITPLQLITAVSSIANDGILMQPRIVKQIENPDTNTITTIDPVQVRKVISKETAKKMVNMMESVVTDGGGKFGQVNGYTVGGKTGTSEPSPGSENDGYVSSFVAISPVENTKVVVLLTLYDPNGSSYYGGKICAPVVSQILSEVLPYLGIPSTDEEDSNDSSSQSTTNITLPDIRNKTVAEAKKILENAGLKCSISGSSDKIVSDQVPKPGTSLASGSIVKLYAEGSDARVSSTVPDLKGMTLSQAKNSLESKNLNIKSSGNGKVISQDPTAGTSVEEGTVITVTLQEDLNSLAH